MLWAGVIPLSHSTVCLAQFMATGFGQPQSYVDDEKISNDRRENEQAPR